MGQAASKAVHRQRLTRGVALPGLSWLRGVLVANGFPIDQGDVTPPALRVHGRPICLDPPLPQGRPPGSLLYLYRTAAIGQIRQSQNHGIHLAANHSYLHHQALLIGMRRVASHAPSCRLQRDIGQGMPLHCRVTLLACQSERCRDPWWWHMKRDFCRSTKRCFCAAVWKQKLMQTEPMPPHGVGP